MADEKKDAEVKVEEAAINAYMDGPSNGEAVKDDDRKAYYKQRYNGVKSTYKFLVLQKEEAEAYKDKAHKAQLLNKLTPLFRENYIERLAIVTELRKLGETVDDQFVPLSKV